MSVNKAGTSSSSSDRSSPAYSRRAVLQTSAAAAALAVSGAASVTARRQATGAWPEPELQYSLINERIFDTKRQSFLPAAPERLIHPGWLDSHAAAATPLVCVGEEHSHPLHHRMEFNVIKAIHGLTQDADEQEPLAVGMEMFYRQHQKALDRYVYLHGSLGLLKLETGWDDMWGYDFNNYTKIFRYARLNGIRLVGLNAPLPLVTLVRKQGLDGLPRELSALLPDIDLGNGRHRERFEAAIAEVAHVHPVSGDSLFRMYQAQTLWEEYMAESAANYLNKVGGKLVLLAGSRHIEARDGIPDRAHRRLRGAKPFTVVPLSVDWTAEGLPNIDHPPGESFADWIYFTQKELALQEMQLKQGGTA